MGFIRFDPEEQRTRRTAEKAANLRILAATRGSGGSYAGSTTEPAPKSPADRKQAVRDLAMGEDCQVGWRPVCRHSPEYTVWAHTNTQGDEKGMGYKGHDSEGMFACDRCHEVIDKRLLPPIQLEELVRGAKHRTVIRLRFIANSITERPWRVRTARWALEQLEGRKS